MSRSTHFDPDGNARMVDVTTKPVTIRKATAIGVVTMQPATAQMIQGGQASKGDVLGVARLAAIQATKSTPQLIPLCHAIPIEAVTVEFDWPTGDPLQVNQAHQESPVPQRDAGDTPDRSAPKSLDHEGSTQLRCMVTVQTSAKTGVEMEAMTGAAVACLTVYDMVKSVDRDIMIGPIALLAKSGGKSGEYRRST